MLNHLSLRDEVVPCFSKVIRSSSLFFTTATVFLIVGALVRMSYSLLLSTSQHCLIASALCSLGLNYLLFSGGHYGLLEKPAVE